MSKQVDEYLNNLHESFGSTAGSIAGTVANKAVKAVYHTGKFVGKTAAKTAYKGSKAAGKGAYRFGKGFIKGVRNKKKLVAAKVNKISNRKVPSPYDVAKSYFKKPLNKMRKK